jgi:hypothetical protein
LFEDKQRAKLGGADTSQMYLLFQVLCSMICSGISPYLDKTAESDVVFSKSLISIYFVRNKIEEKYHAGFSQKQRA